MGLKAKVVGAQHPKALLKREKFLISELIVVI
jgi:hypothetical protein